MPPLPRLFLHAELPSGLPESLLPAFVREEINAFFASTTIQHAAKPRFALIVPDRFDAQEPAHRCELAIALSLAAQLLPGYAFEVRSDADLSGLLDGVQPLSPIPAEYVFALVLLDRELARTLASQLPVRLVGSDCAARFPQKLRLSFFDPRTDAGPVSEAARVDMASLRGSKINLFIDPFTPFQRGRELLLRLRAASLSPCVVLLPSCGKKELLAWQKELPTPGALHLWLGDESPLPECEVLCATDRFVLELFPPALRRIYIGPDGVLQQVESGALDRTRHVLYKGEDLNPLLILDRLLLGGSPLDGGKPAAFMQPLISIIVPVYDRDAEIDRLAASIFVQAYPHLEVVFVCNGSPPATCAAVIRAKALLLARRMHVRILRLAEALGAATIPRDIGAHAARGDFLCFLDSDDFLEAGFFDGFLRGAVDESAIYHPHRIFRDGGRPMPPEFPFEQRLAEHRAEGLSGESLYAWLREHGNAFCNSGVMISRRLFLAARGIWHELHYAEDYYLWLRLAKIGARAVAHSGTVSITLHPGNSELRTRDPAAVARAIAQSEAGVQ